VRKYIEDKRIPLTKEAQEEVGKRQGNERDSKNKGNISIEIRRRGGELSYLSMDYLANLVDKPPHKDTEAAFQRRRGIQTHQRRARTYGALD